MKYLIVTNNPSVTAKQDQLLFMESSVETTLIKVRDLVYEGYELISHPLAASLRMLFSPFRSVILGKKLEKVDWLSAITIEDSIAKYKRHTGLRKNNPAHDADYKMLDRILLETALAEQPNIW